MRPRFSLLIALVLATVALAYAGSRVVLPMAPPAVHAPLPSSAGSYLGVYATGSPPSYRPIADFAQAAGKQPNLAGYYSGWAQPFVPSFAEMIRSHGLTPFVQIDPTYAVVPAIAAGAYDAYLRSYADSVRKFGHAVVIGFGHEMNGPWYSWGYGHVAPSTFVAAWKHIVTLFRGQGAENVTWLWTINAESPDRPGTGPAELWWPGARYVTWVGIDGYYYTPADTFARVFGHTIDQVRKFTRKPVLLSETAVGPRTDQVVKIDDLFRGMRQYKTLGLVWFDKAQHDGILGQDWRLEDSTVATAAFRLNAAADLKLARP